MVPALPWRYPVSRLHRTHDRAAISDHDLYRHNHSYTPGTIWSELHPQPFLSGGKLSFKLTPNFEFGMAKTTVYGGPGNPLTITTFLDSTFGRHYHGDVLGDGRTSADFSYRLPGFRNWLTLYGETLSEDEPSPIPYMRRNASQGGLYLAKVP